MGVRILNLQTVGKIQADSDLVERTRQCIFHFIFFPLALMPSLCYNDKTFHTEGQNTRFKSHLAC